MTSFSTGAASCDAKGNYRAQIAAADGCARVGVKVGLLFVVGEGAGFGRSRGGELES